MISLLVQEGVWSEDRRAPGIVTYGAPDEITTYRNIINEFPPSLFSVWVFSVVLGERVTLNEVNGFFVNWEGHSVWVPTRTIDVWLQNLRTRRPGDYSILIRWIEYTRNLLVTSDHSSEVLLSFHSPTSEGLKNIRWEYKKAGMNPLTYGADKDIVYMMFCRMLFHVVNSCGTEEEWQEIIQEAYMKE